MNRDDPEELKHSFLTFASHDLRGTLANVRGFASLLNSGRIPLDAKGERAAEVILRNTDKALALLQDTFDLLRAERSPVPVEREEQALKPLIEKAVESAVTWSALENAGVDVSDYPDDLKLRVDGERFRHALSAFLEQGLTRAGESAGEEDGARTTLRISDEEGGTRFDVEDDGAAPTEQELEETFDARVRTEKEHRLGTGFRLALARAEVEAHGGWVRAEALPDGGARHSFWLPGDEPDRSRIRSGDDGARPVSSPPVY